MIELFAHAIGLLLLVSLPALIPLIGWIVGELKDILLARKNDERLRSKRGKSTCQNPPNPGAVMRILRKARMRFLAPRIRLQGRGAGARHHSCHVPVLRRPGSAPAHSPQRLRVRRPLPGRRGQPGHSATNPAHGVDPQDLHSRMRARRARSPESRGLSRRSRPARRGSGWCARFGQHTPAEDVYRASSYDQTTENTRAG